MTWVSSHTKLQKASRFVVDQLNKSWKDWRSSEWSELTWRRKRIVGEDSIFFGLYKHGGDGWVIVIIIWCEGKSNWGHRGHRRHRRQVKICRSGTSSTGTGESVKARKIIYLSYLLEHTSATAATPVKRYWLATRHSTIALYILFPVWYLFTHPALL